MPTLADQYFELMQLIAGAQSRRDAMTPEQKAEHDRLQRESLARGMAPCEHGVLDFETCPDCRRRAAAILKAKQAETGG